ncbi:MAG: glutathione synthase [Planctomycetota bacterium]
MRIVFLMDPLAGINPVKDTSFQFMCCADARDHELFHCAPGAISVADGALRVRVSPITAVDRDATACCRTAAMRVLSQDEIDLVVIRTDPPFNDRYLHDTWLLDLLPPQVTVVNAPAGIRSVNEKLWACRFPELLPPTLVTTDREAYLAFLAQMGEVVVKPTDGFGGQGVFRVAAGDPNARVAFETTSAGGQRDVIVQRYLSAASSGDKRILLLEGDILGAVLRVHGDEDHRNNFFAGGSAAPTRIDADDQRIADTLRPHLRALGLSFVGIDVIGGHLVEVNVTSPTCLQEAMRLTDEPLDERVIDCWEGKVRAARESGT